MPPVEYSLRHYVAANGKRPFAEWLYSLSDRNAAARVQIRLERLRLGNFGDARSLGKGLSELRIDIGPGYRVYFTVEGRSVVLLFCGGDKTTQPKDIRRAREYLVDYRRRTDA
ncbi:MAG: type II toxin-antitoxin system RelE/ParE family toxin [Candidatus Solibacter sp.]|jgi:putative addiction module killer protein